MLLCRCAVVAFYIFLSCSLLLLFFFVKPGVCCFLLFLRSQLFDIPQHYQFIQRSKNGGNKSNEIFFCAPQILKTHLIYLFLQRQLVCALHLNITLFLQFLERCANSFCEDYRWMLQKKSLKTKSSASLRSPKKYVQGAFDSRKLHFDATN